ncbi:MAG: ABC transporter permease [Christensenellaceae bacterium]|nr:ABC transporter permease [Christensenellaceae bacterium]MEA5068453.1 ABC transporter permease [Christensenellaceae bacterium]
MDKLKNLLKRYNWEFMLLMVLIAINIMNRSLSPYYDIANLADATNSFLDRGLIGLSMTFVILTGMIDISVASTVALSSVVMAVSYNGGVPMPLAIMICLAVGLVCGMLNGLLLTRFKELASMIVTLSTQIIYRGIALIILGDQASGKFPKWFKVLGWSSFLGLPVMAWAFLIFFIAFAFVLHKTRYGRALYAIGMNPTVARFSGIDVDRAVFINFALNGLMAGVMALFLTSRTGSSRPNIAVGYEMDIIAMVVLGGVSTAGGKGRMFGVLISIFIVGLIRYGLGLININQQILMIVIGLLLIVSVALPEIRAIVERRRHEKRVMSNH